MDEEIVTDAVKILAPDSLKTFVDTFRLLKKIFLGRFTADVRRIRVQADANAAKIVKLLQHVEAEKQRRDEFIAKINKQLMDQAGDIAESKRLFELKAKAEKDYDNSVKEAEQKMAERIKEQEEINGKMMTLIKEESEKKRQAADEDQKKHFEDQKSDLENLMAKLKAEADAKFEKNMSELEFAKNLTRMVEEQKKAMEEKYAVYIPSSVPVFNPYSVLDSNNTGFIA